MILNYVYKNKLLKAFIRLLLGRLYKRRLYKKNLDMLSLQTGIYKKHFDYIKDINI